MSGDEEHFTHFTLMIHELNMTPLQAVTSFVLQKVSSSITVNINALQSLRSHDLLSAAGNEN